MAFFRFILIFLFLIIILTAVGAGIAVLFRESSVGEALYNLKRSSDGKTRFRDRDLRVSFSYPSAWKKELLSPTMVRFWKEGVTLILETKKMEKGKEYSLSEYTEKNLAELAASAEYDGFTFVLEESRESILSGFPAYRVTVLMGTEGRTNRAIQVWTIDKKQVFSLTFSTSLDQFEESVHLFENVIQSFEIMD